MSRGPHGGMRTKRRFCTSYPQIEMCRRGPLCAFAHSREEITAPLLSAEEENQEPSALTDEFFMYKYKTRWCPIGVQHEWHTCVYAHNYQDARRPVDVGYGARLCPYWNKKDSGAEYSQRCPLGLRCPYSHGAKEQLYHPHYFKTVICRDLRGKACPRHTLCAFFHSRQERRCPPSDGLDYSQPLQNEALAEDWSGDFSSPPFLPELDWYKPEGGDGGDGSIRGGMVPYGHQIPNGDQHGGQYVPQMPYLILVPVNNSMPPGSPGPNGGGGGGCGGEGHSGGANGGAGLEMPSLSAPGAGGIPTLPPNWVYVPNCPTYANIGGCGLY